MKTTFLNQYTWDIFIAKISTVEQCLTSYS